METIENYIELEGRKIMYDVTGHGPPIVFVHGVWATGGVWYPVIDRLADRFQCINIHLPLGVHRYASPASVDHSPHALARVVAKLLEALDLRDVTLVGNDTGGAICQLVIADHRDRIGKLVLTNCDAFEVFPPKNLEFVYGLAKSSVLWTIFAKIVGSSAVRGLFFKTVSNSVPEKSNLKMLMGRFANDARVREDLRLTIGSIHPRITLEAATSFASFERPVLVLWGTADQFFPVALGRRLAGAFPNSRFTTVAGSKLFVGLDAPDEVAAAIAEFASSPRPDAVSGKTLPYGAD